MCAAQSVQAEAAPAEKLKVFISYSRKDLAFALRLVEALEARALDVLIDTRDLPLAVEFQKELLGFIRQADTVVYVVSPDSIGSKWVAWEIEQVELLSKRLAPVVARDVQADTVPDGIRKINYVFFTGANAEGERFEAQADALASALKTDLEWIKAHTRWGERARLWDEQGKRSAQLLRGHELAQAEAWSARQPLEAPPLTPLQRDYIATSRKSATRRQRYWITGSALVSVFTAALAFLAYVQKEAADASAIETRHTLALADRRKAAELSAPTANAATQQPGRALAYLARAMRNDPANSGIGRRALFLMAEHSHLRPLATASGAQPALAERKAIFTDGDGTEPGAIELVSPDGSWALNLKAAPVGIRRAGEGAFEPLKDAETFGFGYRGAAFPDHSRFAALAGGTWVDGSGISELRIISDAGEIMGRRYFDGEIIEGMGFSPDGRVLSVSLLAPRTGSGSGSEGRQRTLLLDVAPHGDNLDLVELRSVEQPVKTIRFSPDSRTIDIDGQLFSVGRVIADEPLAVESLKQVQFSGDSSRMNILSGEDRWLSVDTATGLETEGAPVVPGKFPPPKIKTAKAGGAVEVSVAGTVKFSAADPRIILGGASEDGERLIWIRDDGSAQIVPLAAGALGGEWRSLRALYGRPWHEWTHDFLTVGDNGAARWSLIYRAEKRDAAAWKASLGSIAPAAGDRTMSSAIALHPGGRIAAIGETGTTRVGVNLVDVLTGKPLLDTVGLASSELTLLFSRDGSNLFVHGSSTSTAVGQLDVLDVSNGLAAKTPQIYAGPFVERPDGRRVVALGGNGDGPEFIFDMLGDATPVPSWIADLAEGVGGWRLGGENVLRPLTPEEQTASVETARKALAARKGGADRWVEFAAWYLSDDPDPTISPYSRMSSSQLAKRKADDWARAHAPTSSALPDAAPKGEQEGASNPQPRTFARPGTVVAEQTATTPGPAATSSIEAEGGAAPPDAPVQPEQSPPAASAPVVTAKAEPEAAMPAKGAYHVQVGAFLQKSEADKHITLVATRAGDLVRNHAPVVIPPQGGSSKFYRARFTGFDEKQARETCQAMKLQKIDCIAAKGE